jgi:hypothetical protein
MRFKPRQHHQHFAAAGIGVAPPHSPVLPPWGTMAGTRFGTYVNDGCDSSPVEAGRTTHAGAVALVAPSPIGAIRRHIGAVDKQMRTRQQ